MVTAIPTASTPTVDATNTSVPMPSIPTLGPNDPWHVDIMYDSQQPLPENVAYGDLAIIGVVRELLPARWTTQDGQEPTDLSNLASGVTIVTPVVIELDQPPLLDLRGYVGTQPRAILVTEGGSVGRATVTTNGPFNHYSVGKRVAVGAFALDNDRSVVGGEQFLQAVPAGYTMGWLPSSRWKLSATTATLSGESMPLDAFLTRLDAAIAQQRARDTGNEPATATPTP